MAERLAAAAAGLDGADGGLAAAAAAARAAEARQPLGVGQGAKWLVARRLGAVGGDGDVCAIAPMAGCHTRLYGRGAAPTALDMGMNGLDQRGGHHVRRGAQGEHVAPSARPLAQSSAGRAHPPTSPPRRSAATATLGVLKLGWNVLGTPGTSDVIRSLSERGGARPSQLVELRVEVRPPLPPPPPGGAATRSRAPTAERPSFFASRRSAAQTALLVFRF